MFSFGFPLVFFGFGSDEWKELHEYSHSFGQSYMSIAIRLAILLVFSVVGLGLALVWAWFGLGFGLGLVFLWVSFGFSLLSPYFLNVFLWFSFGFLWFWI
jgi:hypothetical protein